MTQKGRKEHYLGVQFPQAACCGPITKEAVLCRGAYSGAKGAAVYI